MRSKSGAFGSLTMPKGLKRYYGRGDLHFITFSCYRRLPLLERVRTRSLFVKVLDEVRVRYEFALIGYVVMPEHVHLLIGEPRKGTPSDALKALKQGFSRRVQAKRRGKGVPANQRKLPFRGGAPRISRVVRRWTWSRRRSRPPTGAMPIRAAPPALR